jgi:hypothetical protein
MKKLAFLVSYTLGSFSLILLLAFALAYLLAGVE